MLQIFLVSINTILILESNFNIKNSMLEINL